MKCEQMLALAKDHHSKEVAEFTKQKDALEDKLTQLQEKVEKSTSTNHKHIYKCKIL